jgi:hypothetical protein
MDTEIMIYLFLCAARYDTLYATTKSKRWKSAISGVSLVMQIKRDLTMSVIWLLLVMECTEQDLDAFNDTPYALAFGR